jgi:hypothetical protein
MLVVAAMSIVSIAAGLLRLTQASSGVDVEHLRIGPTPVRIFRAAEPNSSEPRPVVVIAHGFAGSQQLMQSFAITLARNGYLAVTFDFFGHGRNLEPLAGDVTAVDGATEMLVEQTRSIADFALDLPGARDGLSVLGHSMASDIVVRYALRDDRVDATVAVSMFSPAVTATAPRNLLVIVGAFEGMLIDEALRVLKLVNESAEEGVTVGRFDNGSARRVVVANGVEHVGVLYSAESMAETVAWLNAVYGRESPGYTASRGSAIALLIGGVWLLAWPLSGMLPRVSRPACGIATTWRQLLLAATIPAVATPLLLWSFPADFFGVAVGGYLAVHFLLYGLVTVGCIAWLRRTGAIVVHGETNITRFVVATLLATAYIAGLVALILDTWVTSFAITVPRIPLVLLMLAGTLSYFLADEWLTRGAAAPPGAAIYSRFCFLGSLAIAVALSFEDLFFLLIIAAVILLYFVVYGFFSRWIYQSTRHPAVGAIANAIAFAWALAVVFPMLST